jgi:hypothetical protein
LRSLADINDEIMEKYLRRGGKLSPEEIRKASKRGHL